MLLQIIFCFLAPVDLSGLQQVETERGHKYPVSIVRVKDCYHMKFYSDYYNPTKLTYEGVLHKTEAFTYRLSYVPVIESNPSMRVSHFESWTWNPVDRTLTSTRREKINVKPRRP